MVKNYSVDSKHKGVVTKVVPYGVLVKMERGIEGLIHASKMPAEVAFAEGQEVQIFIESVDLDREDCLWGGANREAGRLQMKTKSQFVCQQCGYSQSQWAGKCPSCDVWNSMVETTFTETRNSKHQILNKSQIINLKDIKIDEKKRLKTGEAELDNVLGEGWWGEW